LRGGHGCYWCNHGQCCWHVCFKCLLQRTRLMRPFQSLRQHYWRFMQLNFRQVEGKWHVSCLQNYFHTVWRAHSPSEGDTRTTQSSYTSY
jgi:hypothetical protein